MSVEWPGGRNNEPDELILDFLAKLPPMVKDSVLAGCILAFDLVRFDPFQDKLGDLRSLINDYDVRERHYACAMLIAVVELCLEDTGVKAKFYQELWEQHGIEVARDIALREPLRERQYQNAREAFRELRENSLTPRILHIWQGFLLTRDDNATK